MTDSNQPETVKVFIGEYIFVVRLKKIVDVFTVVFQTKVDAPVALRKLGTSQKDVVEKAVQHQKQKKKISNNSKELWSYFL